MTTSPASHPPNPPRSRIFSASRNKGFTLVEVVLAIGVIAFAVVSMLALLPTGMSIFRQALDNSIGSQIVNRLVNEAQQTAFPILIATQPTKRYFDDQGNEVDSISKSIYTVEVSVVAPTKLPSTSTTSLATVTIKLVNNPTQITNPFEPTSNLRYATYTALIAKNQ